MLFGATVPFSYGIIADPSSIPTPSRDGSPDLPVHTEGSIEAL